MSHVFNGVEVKDLLRGDGVDTRSSVRAASTGLISLSSNLNGATIDGVTLAAGDRILVKNQTEVAEVTTVTCVADVADSLNGTYFYINSVSTEYYVWIKTSGGASMDPAVAGKTGVQVSVTTNDTASAVAIAVASALNALGDFSSPMPGGTTATITNANVGNVVDASDNDTGFTIMTTAQGSSALDHGIYEVGSAANTTYRADDLIDGDDAAFTYCHVQEGTVNQQTTWTCTTNPGIVGTNSISWTQSGLFKYTTGDLFYADSSSTLGKLNAPGSLSLLQMTSGGAPSWVDKSSISAGLDPKESVRIGTRTDVGGSYTAAGGTGGTGAFTGIDLTSNTIFDLNGGGTTVAVSDRILLKDQTDAKQNGIYVVTTAGATGVIERASDQNGSTPGDVSSGNFTFVETGDTLASTQWYLTGDGVLTLNTDNLVWVQFGASTSYSGGDGIDITAAVISADLKANGGLVIDTAQIAVDLGATNITGTLGVGDGGTGLTGLASGSLLVGSGTSPMTALAAVDNRVLTSESSTLGWRTRLHTLNIFGDSASRPEVMIFNSTSDSAVNELTVANAITANSPVLSATGDDTNINLALQAKGTGVFNLLSTATAAATLRFYENTGDGSNYVGLKAGTIGSDVTFTLPVADGTTANDILVTNAAGALSFKTYGATFRQSHSIISAQVQADAILLTAVGYFNWNNAEYTGITSGKIFYEVEYTNRTLQIEVYNETTSTSLGSTTHSASGFFSLSFTLPSANARLSVRVRKTGGGGTDPNVYGIQMVFNPKT